jgi:hypothetical protein
MSYSIWVLIPIRLTASAASAPLAEQLVCVLGIPSAEKLKLIFFGLGFPAEGEKVVKPLMVKVLGVVSLVMRLVGRAEVRAKMRRTARARRRFVESMMSVVFGGIGESVGREEVVARTTVE